MPPHDPARHTQCPRHGVRESRTRLAQHSVAARQDLRGTLCRSLFYCNRKPPLSASSQHRFMKHPAPIFKTKAPAPPPHPAVHLEKTRIFRQIGSEKLYGWGRGKFVKKLYKKRIIPDCTLLFEKTHIFEHLGTGLFCPKIEQNKPVPECPVPGCPKSFRCALTEAFCPVTARNVQNLHIRINFSCAKLNI